jgi:hypothetical protein
MEEEEEGLPRDVTPHPQIVRMSISTVARGFALGKGSIHFSPRAGPYPRDGNGEGLLTVVPPQR